jgi:hypothetical protein
MKNWFKISILLILVSVLYLCWDCIQVQKEMSLNGRYIPVQIMCVNGGDAYGGTGNFVIIGNSKYLIIDTRNGNSYDSIGRLQHKFIIDK